MSHELPSNVQMLCKSCAPQPGHYDNLPANFFVGRLVKKAFRAVDLNGKIKKEHMWVDIYAVEGNTLKGFLKNDPFLIPAETLKNGDEVTMTVHDVEDVQGLER